MATVWEAEAQRGYDIAHQLANESSFDGARQRIEELAADDRRALSLYAAWVAKTTSTPPGPSLANWLHS
jgi:hypothetical protein